MRPNPYNFECTSNMTKSSSTIERTESAVDLFEKFHEVAVMLADIAAATTTITTNGDAVEEVCNKIHFLEVSGKMLKA